MTGRQVLLNVLNGKDVPRTPVVLFSAGAWTFNTLGLALSEVIGDSQAMSDGISRTFTDRAPSDAVWVGSGFNNLPVKALGGRITYPRKGTPQVVETIDLAGDPAGYTDGAERLALDEDVQSLWETTARVKASTGNETVIGACGWGPFTLAGQIYGTERLMSEVYKDPRHLRGVLDFAVEAASRYYKGFIEEGAEIISIAEPIASGDMISRKHFEAFVVPALKAFLDRLKGWEVYNLLHICGNITNRLDLIPDTGVDILSVDYKVDLKQVRAVIGERTVFAGNVNPADVLQQGSPRQVTEASHRCIRDAGGTNFILMPGCDIPPDVPAENIRAFFEAPSTFQIEQGERT